MLALPPACRCRGGNVQVSNLQVLNAFLYMAEQGCKWRALPEQFGPWNTVYRRLNRWAKKGVLDEVFARLQREGILRIKLEVAGLDSTIVPVHPDGTGSAKKNGPQAVGRSRGGWTTKIHLVAADERTMVTGALSPGQAGDAPQGRQLLRDLGPLADHDLLPDELALVMDRAYEGDGDPPAGHGPGLRAGGAAPLRPPRTLGLRPGVVQAAQRGGAALPPAQGLAPGLHSLRQVGRDVLGLCPPGPDCRSLAIVSTRPKPNCHSSHRLGVS